MERKEFLIDENIIEGLFKTIDNKKVLCNCKNYNIDILESQLMEVKLSKRGIFCVVTICFGNNRFIQYKIDKMLDLRKLDRLNSNVISNNLKKQIHRAFQMTNLLTLSDLLEIY
jgi:hypothetical protein